ncbi:MAG: 2-C-methyl-D-erythritol 2,4-cyclodiphosphate synthase [Ruminococcaceae bacterium]|nr:2-C-methyl-D-erythritol 2,4-cyclodiphosphate synthase [Oscillospiraceae bacterium]
MCSFRIGQGMDVHRTALGRKLVLGGVMIECGFGLLGHSDADVLCHAITDALLGSLALGDIGTHFPDTDPAYKGADSTVLLKEAYGLVREKGYGIVNLDCTVVTEQPKLKPYVPQIQNRIAELLSLDAECVSIKAKTAERLGAVGEGRAMEAYCTVLVAKDGTLRR